MKPNKKICKINSTNKRTEAFCQENLCNGNCLTAKLENRKILRLAKTNSPTLNCYQIYNIRELIKNNKIDFISSADCQVFGQLSYQQKDMKTIFTIDSGAQVSCLSNKIASKLMGHLKNVKLGEPDKILQGANNTNLTCSGKIALYCTLANTTCKIEFYIIKDMQNGILGLDAIRKFKLNITADHISFKTNKQTNQVLRVNELIEEEIKFPMWVSATPTRKYAINSHHPVVITVKLDIKSTWWNIISYQQGAIYHCSCKIVDKELCPSCKNGPHAQNTIEPGGELKIQYKPTQIYDLVPKTDFFQVKIFKTPCTEGTGLIDAVPPGIEYDQLNGLSISSGLITLNGEATFDQIYPITRLGCELMVKSNTNTLIEREECCVNCRQAKYKFCSYRNPQCLELDKLRTILDIKKEHKCLIIKCTEFEKCQGNDFIGFHRQSQDKGVTEYLYQIGLSLNMKTNQPIDENVKMIEACNQNKNLHCGIITVNISYLNIIDCINRIRQLVEEHKLTSVHFLHFNILEISEYSILNTFSDNRIKIFIYEKGFKMKNKMYQRIRQIKRDDTEIENKINLVLDCANTKKWLVNLCKRMDKKDQHLNSLWSKSSLDIGTFISREPPYQPIKFNIPLREDMKGVPPKPVKTAFLAQRLVPAAKQMLDELESKGVIARGFSQYNARTFFLPKAPLELSLNEWIAKGNSSESFVAGSPNKDVQNLNLRIVHHFVELNERTACTPLYQPSGINQLRRISPAIKYISIVDITSAFFALCLSEESALYTGFDVGIEQYGRFYYKRAPMGAQVSKTLQDASLMYCLSDLSNYIIYSDNVVIVSENISDHKLHVEQILTRLRTCGMKCKLEKASFFVTQKCKLYGHILDLEHGKILAEPDKLAALRSKPVPKNITMLKSFLGALTFMGSLLPIAGRELAILHIATRGKTLTWEKEQQMAYESILKLLAEPGLVQIYRGNPEIPYRCSIDSSEFHTSYAVFQIDHNQQNRPICYNLKTWPPSFQAQIPEMRELMGICFTLMALRADYEFQKHPMEIYSDSLPYILCNLAARFNRKVARIKLLLDSYNWIRLNWSPGTSAVIALADHYSRQDTDKPLKVRLPNTSDSEICQEIKNKIDCNKLYSGPKCNFLINSLIDLDKSTFESIKPASACLNNEGKLIFNTLATDQPNQAAAMDVEYDDSQSERGRNYDSQSEESIATSELQNSAANKPPTEEPITIVKSTENQKEVIPPVNINKVITRSSVINKPKETRKHINEKNNTCFKSHKVINDHLSHGKPLELTRVDLQKYPLTYNDSNNEQVIKLQNVPDMINARSSNFIPYNVRDTSVTGNSETARWFKRFLSQAKYLDIDKLSKAQEKDPHWAKIIMHCKKKGTYTEKNKVFYIYRNVLIVRENLQHKRYLYKLILPKSIAYDTCLISHRQLLHAKAPKLANTLRQSFEIHNLMDLAKHICEECVLCTYTSPAPAGAVRMDLPKHPSLIRKPASCWHVDILALTCPDTGKKIANFHKIIVGICAFSHFIVIEALQEDITSEIFLKFVQTRLYNFGRPDYIVTDNEAALISDKVQHTCDFLGIIKLTCSPYSSKSNLAEAANRLILAGLRSQCMSKYIRPELIHVILCNTIDLLNGMAFSNSQVLSPHLLMFGRPPKTGLMQIYSKNYSSGIDKHEYLRSLMDIHETFTTLRLNHFRGKEYPELKNKHQSYYNRIIPGSIVILKNPEKIIKKANHKLLPLFKSKFIVIERTKSSAMLRPLSGLYLKDFLDKSDKRKGMPQFAYSCDISQLKLVGHSQLLHTTKKKQFLENFGKNHTVPKPMYCIEQQSQGLLRNWEELNPEDTEDLEKELIEAEQIFRTEKETTEVKTILVDNYRKRQIQEIVDIFKSLNSNTKINVIKGIPKVGFNNKVIVRHLVQPQIIYFCKKPVMQELKDEPGKMSRFHTGRDQFACSCGPCLKMLNNCKKLKCPQCVIKSDQFDQYALSTQQDAVTSRVTHSPDSASGASSTCSLQPEEPGSLQLGEPGDQDDYEVRRTWSWPEQARNQRL